MCVLLIGGESGSSPRSRWRCLRRLCRCQRQARRTARRAGGCRTCRSTSRTSRLDCSRATTSNGKRHDATRPTSPATPSRAGTGTKRAGPLGPISPRRISVDPVVCDITTWQLECTDWDYRVRANYANSTSGPWTSRVAVLTPRRAPSAPNLDLTHRGTVAETALDTDDNNFNEVQLAAKWPLAYCQTDYEIWETTRKQSRLDNVNLNWSDWEQVAGAEVSDVEGAPEESTDGSTSTQYTTTRDLGERGTGYGVAVRVRNRRRLEQLELQLVDPRVQSDLHGLRLGLHNQVRPDVGQPARQPTGPEPSPVIGRRFLVGVLGRRTSS